MSGKVTQHHQNRRFRISKSWVRRDSGGDGRAAEMIRIARGKGREGEGSRLIFSLGLLNDYTHHEFESSTIVIEGFIHLFFFPFQSFRVPS